MTHEAVNVKNEKIVIRSWNNDESMIIFWIIRKEKWKTNYGVYSRTILGSYDNRGFLFDVFGQVKSSKSVIQKSNKWILVTYASFTLWALWKFGWNVFGSTQGISKKALVSIQVGNCQHFILFLFTSKNLSSVKFKYKIRPYWLCLTSRWYTKDLWKIFEFDIVLIM